MSTTLNELRKILKQQAEQAINKRDDDNSIEFIPPFGKTNVRFLPGIEGEMFYYTHSFHYLPINGGRYVYTYPTYNVNGKILKDPFDVAVAKWYETGKATKDNELLRLASIVKRKKHYLFHVILLDEPDPEKKYRILIDRSNKGRLARIICVTMGLPFFYSLQDGYIRVDKDTLNIDEDKEYVDLLDIDNGYDFRIVKTQTGTNPWDVSYADSFPLKKKRPLTKEERELLDRRISLKSYVQYEEDYFKVKEILESFLESLENGEVNLDDNINNNENVNDINKSNNNVVKSEKLELKTDNKNKLPQSEDELDEILKELDDDTSF